MDQPPATTPEAAAAPAPAPDDSPPVSTAGDAEQPGFRTRGRARRRARFLRKARELAYRDLGGLVFSLHRFGQRNDALVIAKLSTLGHIDAELRSLEGALGEHQPMTVLHEAGITACPRCAALHSGEDHFCPNCGLPISRRVDLPIGGAPSATAGVPTTVTAANAIAPDGAAPTPSRSMPTPRPAPAATPAAAAAATAAHTVVGRPPGATPPAAPAAATAATAAHSVVGRPPGAAPAAAPPAATPVPAQASEDRPESSSPAPAAAPPDGPAPASGPATGRAKKPAPASKPKPKPTRAPARAGRSPVPPAAADPATEPAAAPAPGGRSPAPPAAAPATDAQAPASAQTPAGDDEPTEIIRPAKPGA